MATKSTIPIKKKKTKKKPEEPFKLDMSFDEAVALTLKPNQPAKHKKKPLL
jgi:hypothetical protein